MYLLIIRLCVCVCMCACTCRGWPSHGVCVCVLCQSLSVVARFVGRRFFVLFGRMAAAAPAEAAANAPLFCSVSE